MRAKGCVRVPSPAELPIEDETKTPALSSRTHGSSFGSFSIVQPGGGGGAPPSCTGMDVPASTSADGLNGADAHAQKTNEDKALAMDTRMGKYLRGPIGSSRPKLR